MTDSTGLATAVLAVATVVLAVAAMVQASAARAIVGLTRRLADTAISALAVSAQHEAAARAANRELRRQGQLAAVPILRVVQPHVSFYSDGRAGDPPPSPGEASFNTVVRIHNPTAVAALAVRVELYGMHGPGQPERNVRCISHEIPLLAPDSLKELVIDSGDLRNIDARKGMSAVAPYYSNDWIMVRARCRGPIGARVIQDYEWNANFRDQNASGVWKMARLVITPDVEGADELVLELRD